MGGTPTLASRKRHPSSRNWTLGFGGACAAISGSRGAAVILEELASERRWDQAFADFADLLAQLADQALAEHQAGKTQRLDPERQ